MFTVSFVLFSNFNNHWFSSFVPFILHIYVLNHTQFIPSFIYLYNFLSIQCHISIFTTSFYINKSNDFITQAFFYNNIQYMASFHIAFHTTVFIFFSYSTSLWCQLFLYISIYLFYLFLFHTVDHYFDLEKGFKTSTCYTHNHISIHLCYCLNCHINFYSICIWEFITCEIFLSHFTYKTFVQLV